MPAWRCRELPRRGLNARCDVFIHTWALKIWFCVFGDEMFLQKQIAIEERVINPKFEFRNPKQIRMTKSSNSKQNELEDRTLAFKKR
jgi:hypothetical protein